MARMSAELPVPLVTRPWWSGRKSAFVAVAVTVYGFALWQTGTNPRAFIEGFPNLVRFVAGMFPPDFSSISHLLGRVVETIRIAVMGTALATAGAFFLAPLAARNISPSPLLYQASRFVCDVFRGISELVWAITFVAMVGLGPFSGVLALAVHSTGALGKYFSEAIEAIDLGIIEATTSTGARRIQVFLHGIFPELRTLFANYTLYYFEHNLRQATVLGIWWDRPRAAFVIAILQVSYRTHHCPAYASAGCDRRSGKRDHSEAAPRWGNCTGQIR